jgi:hypothetical protein
VRALTTADWSVRAYRLWHPPLRSG